MAYSIPGMGERFNYSTPNSNTQYAMDHAFRQITHQSITYNGDQLATDGRHGLYIGRPYEWMEVFGGNPLKSEAYIECFNIWSSLINRDGRFTATGLAVANCLVDPESDSPTLESYIGQKYGFDDRGALSLTSRAMWDLLMIRGLPVAPETPNS